MFSTAEQRMQLARQIPIGTMLPFAGSAAPDGWLLCDGSAVSRVTYRDLYTFLSTAYGAGDGSTTFNLPDMRGRAPTGRTYTTYAGYVARLPSLTSNGCIAGISGGADVATPSSLPAHTHPISSCTLTHGHDASGDTDNWSHRHGLGYDCFCYCTSGSNAYAALGPLDDGNSDFSTETALHDHLAAVDSCALAHDHSTTTTVDGAVVAAGGQSHTNTQPTLVLNMIIKA